MRKLGKMALAFTAVAVLTLSYPLSACGPKEPEEESDTYSVVLNYNDGSSRPYTLFVDKGQAFDTPDEPNRTGYQISGWYDSATGGNPVTFPVTPSGDMTLYAQWTAARYDVVFDYQVESSTPYVFGGVDYGSEITQEQADEAKANLPSNSGYYFYRWTTDAAGTIEASFPYAVRRNSTIYASWLSNSTGLYTISFENNIPDSTAQYPSVQVVEGNAVPQSALPRLNRLGYEFCGWATSADATEDEVVTLPYRPAASQTLYAVWKLGTYNVRFRSNTPEKEGEIYLRQSAQGWSTVNEPAAPEREGYTFDGWYTSSLGGEKVEFPYTVTATTNLFAHWKAFSVTTNKFDAEFTEFNPLEGFPGYSGNVSGKNVIGSDGGSLGATTPDYPLYGTATHRNYFVSYMYKRGAKVTFVIESSQAVTGATLVASLAAEYDMNLVLSSAADHAHSYTIAVNGTPIDYGTLNLSGSNVNADNPAAVAATAFSEHTIGTVNLVAGTNYITMETTNNTAMGGTMSATAPMIDFIRIDNYGSAQLSWSPIYDNLYAWLG